jgi:hypothetical protein
VSITMDECSPVVFEVCVNEIVGHSTDNLDTGGAYCPTLDFIMSLMFYTNLQ